MSLATTALRRPLPTHLCQNLQSHIQTRHATLLRRPKRPYTFTQLVTLSDGSTYTHRTTSPFPIYKSTKDTHNSPLWNPSSQKLLNVEADEAGRLKAFRNKFGRGWDAERVDEDEEEGDDENRMDGKGEEGRKRDGEREEEDNLMDLISGYGTEAQERGEAMGKRTENEGSGKGKGGER